MEKRTKKWDFLRETQVLKGLTVWDLLMTSFALMHPEKFTFMMLSFALCDLCFLSHLVTNIDRKFRFACVVFHTIMVKVFFFFYQFSNNQHPCSTVYD